LIDLICSTTVSWGFLPVQLAAVRLVPVQLVFFTEMINHKLSRPSMHVTPQVVQVISVLQNKCLRTAVCTRTAGSS